MLSMLNIIMLKLNYHELWASKNVVVRKPNLRCSTLENQCGWFLHSESEDWNPEYLHHFTGWILQMKAKDTTETWHTDINGTLQIHNVVTNIQHVSVLASIVHVCWMKTASKVGVKNAFPGLLRKLFTVEEWCRLTNFVLLNEEYDRVYRFLESPFI